MVSFSCESCNDTVTKKKLNQHKSRCYDALFTCIDCNVTFYNNDHNQHTSCITEAEKYEKGVHKGKKQPNSKPEVKEVKKDNSVSEKKSKAKEEKTKTKEDSKPKKVDSKDKNESTPKSPFSQFTTNLKVGKPKNFKKILKTLSKDEQKKLMKNLKITKNSDESIAIHL